MGQFSINANSTSTQWGAKAGYLQRKPKLGVLSNDGGSFAHRRFQSFGMSKYVAWLIPLILRGRLTLPDVEPRWMLINCPVPDDGAVEWLEPDEGRLSCPVLRGRRRSNALLLPDESAFKPGACPKNFLLSG